MKVWAIVASCFHSLGIFLAGFIVCANLSILIGFNPNYEVSWVKVGLAITFALFFMFYNALEKNNES